MTERASNETVQVNLRIKERFRRRIERAAQKNGESLNNEMVRRLEESFRQEELATIVEKMTNLADSIVDIVKQENAK